MALDGRVHGNRAVIGSHRHPSFSGGDGDGASALRGAIKRAAAGACWPGRARGGRRGLPARWETAGATRGLAAAGRKSRRSRWTVRCAAISAARRRTRCLDLQTGQRSGGGGGGQAGQVPPVGSGSAGNMSPPQMTQAVAAVTRPAKAGAREKTSKPGLTRGSGTEECSLDTAVRCSASSDAAAARLPVTA